MSSMAMKILKQKRQEKKVRNKKYSKRTENQLQVELRDKLEKYLSENDKVMIEVSESVLGEFINILDQSVIPVYEYEQIDKNKFVFKNNEIII